MEVDLTPDQRAFVRLAIESGRLRSEQEAVVEALTLWEERERKRSEMLAAVDLAESSLLQDKGRTITERSMRQLSSEIKQRGRSRITSRSSRH